uniref:Uncharacterized protein MANES_02G204000 n=1 Tax=Rhizophora mucronata TaxID=61149 RepID=A0A2P2JK77_RHIMU
MEEAQEVLGNNSLEDASWLCSLSETELDMLISLKMLVLQRARVIGHNKLAEKFDLKMLRALAFVLMEHLKGKFEDLPQIPGLTKCTPFMDGCNLLKCDHAGILSIEQLKACIGIVERKRAAKRSREDVDFNYE